MATCCNALHPDMVSSVNEMPTGLIVLRSSCLFSLSSFIPAESCLFTRWVIIPGAGGGGFSECAF
jgi:hypothetical protein